MERFGIYDTHRSDALRRELRVDYDPSSLGGVDPVSRP